MQIFADGNQQKFSNRKIIFVDCEQILFTSQSAVMMEDAGMDLKDKVGYQTSCSGGREEQLYGETCEMCANPHMTCSHWSVMSPFTNNKNGLL